MGLGGLLRLGPVNGLALNIYRDKWVNISVVNSLYLNVILVEKDDLKILLADFEALNWQAILFRAQRVYIDNLNHQMSFQKSIWMFFGQDILC